MAWLYRTCTRLSIDVLRERRRADLHDTAAHDVPCAVSLQACTEARAAIGDLADTVPETELEAVVLVRVDGLSHPEAATVLGVSERTVRRTLDRFDLRVHSLRKEFSL
jgi:DNA-directed RNA polymerase specialized sigma24 family protein